MLAKHNRWHNTGTVNSRNSHKILSLILACIAPAVCARGYEASDVLESTLLHSLPYNYTDSLSLTSPASKSYLHDAALSSIAAGWQTTGDARNGFFKASSYKPLDSARRHTVWGAASYQGGYLRPAGMAECADYATVWPYALADTVGGRLRAESYAFSGGYGHRGAVVDFGAQLSYKAELTYRRRDPRPRNVAGTLALQGAVGVHLSQTYTISATLGISSYKQSSSIAFYSALGEPVVYHLTGLGTAYARFNSLGKTTRYRGHSFDGAISLLPKRRAGVFATVAVSSFAYDWLLVDLNSLPLATLNHKKVSFEAGWRTRPEGNYLSASAIGSLWRRSGTEHIFGAAEADVYPEIASLDMFRADGSVFGAKAAAVLQIIDPLTLSVTASGTYRHGMESYVEPARRLQCDAFQTEVSPAAYFRLKHQLISLGFSYQNFSPAKRSISGFGDSTGAVVNNTISLFDMATKAYNLIGARLRYDHSIGSALAVGISLSVSHSNGDTEFSAAIIVSL